MNAAPSDPPALDGPSQPPAQGGAPEQIVVLLHGLGADGNDLIGLAPAWSRVLPAAEFLAPHAPQACDMAPFGRQWFSLQDRSQAAMYRGLVAAAPALDAYVSDALAARGLDASRLALAGFSQGGALALHLGLRRSPACAGIVSFSGWLAGPEHLSGEIRARPPTLLVHGDADEVVPHAALGATQQALEAAGVPVRAHTCPGLGHGIDDDGLRLAAALLVSAFGL